jgi:hypothetical protein
MRSWIGRLWAAAPLLMAALAPGCSENDPDLAPTAPADARPQAAETAETPFSGPFAIKVNLPRVDDRDVLKILKCIVAQVPVFSFEIFREPTDSPDFHVKDFAIPEGQFQVGAVLKKIQALSPDVTWTSDGNRIHVKVQLGPPFPDPLEEKVREGLKGPYTQGEILRWLNRQVPDLHIGGPEITWPSLRPAKVVVTIEPGTRVIEAIRQLADGLKVGWGAQIFSRPRTLEKYDPKTTSVLTIPGDRILLTVGEDVPFF